jgi:hypothetical protein
MNDLPHPVLALLRQKTLPEEGRVEEAVRYHIPAKTANGPVSRSLIPWTFIPTSQAALAHRNEWIRRSLKNGRMQGTRNPEE